MLGPTAFLLLQHTPNYRRDAFAAGLTALGFNIGGMPRSGNPRPDDLLVIWNRYGHFDQLARRFELAGAKVIVAENGPLGRLFQGEPWYAITLSNPLAGGTWPEGSPGRWDGLGVKICDWRKSGDEIIILAQRGIGPPGVRQPDGWPRRVLGQLQDKGHRVRIREHPGERSQPVTVEKDIERARCVVTWASGAAFKALLLGVPVFYGFHKWVGREAADPVAVSLTPSWPFRLPTFRRLAWSMWRTPEIARGDPFRHLLGWESGA